MTLPHNAYPFLDAIADDVVAKASVEASSHPQAAEYLKYLQTLLMHARYRLRKNQPPPIFTIIMEAGRQAKASTMFQPPTKP